MSEVLLPEDPEPEPTSANILEGVPCGYNLNRKQDIEKFTDSIQGNIGNKVVCIASDYFIIQPGETSYRWPHVAAYGTRLEGVLDSHEGHELIYDPDDAALEKFALGVTISSLDKSRRVFVAAEDTREIRLIENQS